MAKEVQYLSAKDIQEARKKSLRTITLEKIEQMMTAVPEKKKENFVEGFLKEVQDSAMTGGWAAKPMLHALMGKDPITEIDRLLSKNRREDRDFLSYRVIRMSHDFQQEVILSKVRRLFTMAGRRAGKTQANIKKIVHQAIRDQNSRFLVICLTITKAIEQYFNPFLELLDELGIVVSSKSVNEGFIKLSNGSQIFLRGNNTKDEREKMRGDNWDGVVIDEAQSQKALYYLIDEILSPTLLDRRGWLLLSGTGPRIRGTPFEKMYMDAASDPAKGRSWNWNISHNPFIPDYQEVLEEVKKKNGWTDTTPIFVREYLGKISYDDDALVIRLGPYNFYDRQDLAKWINSQPVTDMHFTAGLDFGFTDYDGFVIILYSDSRPEKWVVHQYKANRIGVVELAEAVRHGLQTVENDPLFKNVLDKYIPIYCDTSHGMVSYDLSQIHHLPVMDAYKQNKDMAYENLQADARRGYFKMVHTIYSDEGVAMAHHLEDECSKTVFRRNDETSANPYELTREIDDEAYHPDLMDAVLYALRKVWVYSTLDESGEIVETSEKAWFDKNQTLPEYMRR